MKQKYAGLTDRKQHCFLFQFIVILYRIATVKL